MSSHTFVSVIIPTYNRCDHLPLTLNSFLAQTYPADRFEIIVVNNNSTDGTTDVIAQYAERFPIIRVVEEKRQGVHYARNSAAKIAKGDILYFTDDDIIAEGDTLLELVKAFALDPMIGSATGKIIGRFEAPPPTWVKKYLINAYLSLTEEDKAEEIVVSHDDLVYSCHEAIRREVFFRCGGFNPENTAGRWIGDGETGLGIKIKAAGYRFAYTAKSIVYHSIPHTRMTFRYLLQRMGNQGYCDAYTEFRSHRTLRGVIGRAFKRNTLGLLRTTLFSAGKVVLGRESWRFLPARLLYLYNRNRYDLKLLTNMTFRKMVEVDDWLRENA
jgi:glycosyltransferase involved in cell wall biosynthesis